MKIICKFWDFLVKNQLWLYRLVLLLLIIIVPFYAKYISTLSYSQRTYLEDVDALFNAADQEPVESNLTIGEDEDQVYLDETLKKIFPEGWDNLSDEAKAIEIERFVTSYLRKQSNGGSATKVLQDGYAICGGMAYVFRTLNRRVGLPARYIGLFYTPVQSSHALTEIYYDKTWHLFDPTFGVFVYSNPTYDQKGHILSLAEIRDNRNAGYIQQVVEKPWIGSYTEDLKKYGVQPTQSNYVISAGGPYGDSFLTFWLGEIREAFPVAYGASSWISAPIDIDLEKQRSQTIGQKDNDFMDMSVYKHPFKGLNFIGKYPDAAGTYNTWYVMAKPSSNITIRYWWIGNSTPADLKVIRLRSIQLIEIEPKQNYTDISIKILDNPSIFIVMAPINSYTIDAIEVWKN